MTKRSEALPGSRPLTRAESLRLQLEGSSSWDRMVSVANRSAVLRCPECGRTGTWEDTPERRRAHLDAIPTKAGREAAGSDVKAGAKVHAMIGQEWRCSACKAPPTRDPKVGRIGSTKENTQTGKGALVSDTNTVEGNAIDLCDAQLRRWKRDGMMTERDDNIIQMSSHPMWNFHGAEQPWDCGSSVGPTQFLTEEDRRNIETLVLARPNRDSAQEKAREFCHIDGAVDGELWFHLTALIDGRYPNANA
jgi:hypothetical protein